MTREKRRKAIDVLKISIPLMGVTQDEFNEYVRTKNEIIDWIERESCDACIDKNEVRKLLDIGWKRGIYPRDAIMALPLVKPRQVDEYRKMLEDIKTEISVARKRQEEIAYGCNDLNERYTHLQMESAYLHCLNIIDKYTKEQEKSNQ